MILHEYDNISANKIKYVISIKTGLSILFNGWVFSVLSYDFPIEKILNIPYPYILLVLLYDLTLEIHLYIKFYINLSPFSIYPV